MSNNLHWHLECNNKIFINKLLAIAENNKSKKPIRFNIPEKYETFDFSTKIDKSLEQLSIEQANKLRDSHDKIIIWYSGGCDSHYVLDTFLKNNIKVDEIHMVKSGFSNADYEIDKYATPFVKKLDIKTVVHEPNLAYYENRYVNDEWQDGTANGYNHHFRLNNDFENLQHHDTDKVAHIFGKDKPKLFFIDGKWYTYFLDVDITPQPHQINFFCDDPIIYSKQCHMLIDKIQMLKNQADYNKVTWYHEDQNFWNKSIGRYRDSSFPLKELNVVNYNNNVVNHNNNVVTHHSKKDAEAINQAPTHIVEAWQQKNKALVEELGADFFNQGDPCIGTVGVFSKFYCITEKSTKTVDELFPNGFKL